MTTHSTGLYVAGVLCALIVVCILQLLSDPERIVDMALPTDSATSSKMDITDMALIKLYVVLLVLFSYTSPPPLPPPPTTPLLPVMKLFGPS